MKSVPVVEVFGPTIQGEGPQAGLPTYFVRLGLCDYRCSWCDSMYAVEPTEVRDNADYLGVEGIVERIRALPLGPQWVTLSGGNPAVHELRPLVAALNDQRLLVSVETQGSLWREWLAHVQMLVVSPKPPSSGMATDIHRKQTTRFMEEATKRKRADARALKIVVFDDDDYEWATEFITTLGKGWRTFVSVGTPIPDDQPIPAILDRFRWLAERVAADMTLRHVRVLPQLHVLAWGQVRGV